MRAGRSSRRPEASIQDSFELGLALEEMTRGARHSLGVSLCVAGDASGTEQATQRDVGVVACTQGFAVTVGGTRASRGRSIGRAAGEREAMEYVCGFLQLYREERRLGEAVASFVHRVSELYVRERLAKDPLGRSQLASRFLAEAAQERDCSPKNCAFSGKF